MMGSLVASLLERIPADEWDLVIKQQVQIMSQASRKGVALDIAAASNLQLIRSDTAFITERPCSQS